MDKIVPTGAAMLLDFIRKIELGRTDRATYEVPVLCTNCPHP